MCLRASLRVYQSVVAPAAALHFMQTSPLVAEGRQLSKDEPGGGGRGVDVRMALTGPKTGGRGAAVQRSSPPPHSLAHTHNGLGEQKLTSGNSACGNIAFRLHGGHPRDIAQPSNQGTVPIEALAVDEVCLRQAHPLPLPGLLSLAGLGKGPVEGELECIACTCMTP